MTRRIASKFSTATGAASLRASPSLQAATDKIIQKASIKQAQPGESLYGSWLFVDWCDNKPVVWDVSTHPHANVRKRVVAAAAARSEALAAKCVAQKAAWPSFDCIYLVWGFLLFMVFWHYGPRILLVLM